MRHQKVQAFEIDQRLFEKELDNYLHKHADAADALLKRILQSERERKEIAGIKNWLTSVPKAALHNKNLEIVRFI